MRIALVTTWGTACGIATYSEELTRALLAAGHEVTILAPAEMGSCIRETGIQVPTIQCWTRSQFVGLPPKMEQILKTAPGFDIVHFQHEHGLFWSATGLLEAIRQIRQGVFHGAHVAVTLHTLFHYGSWQHSGLYDGLKHLADAVIAHTVEGAASIAVARGTHAELVCIPHGTEPGAKGDREEGLTYLGVPQALHDKAVFGVIFGFQGPSKNTICTVRGFADSLSRRYQDTGALIIAGEEGNDGTYFQEIEGSIGESGYGRHVIIRRGFTPMNRVPDVMAAADFGVLNTTSWTLSASGAAHVYMRYGVPLAVANRPIYNEAIRAGAIPFTLDRDAYVPTLSLVNAIGALVRDKGLRHSVGQSMAKYAAMSSWENVAGLHVELYSRLRSR